MFTLKLFAPRALAVASLLALAPLAAPVVANDIPRPKLPETLKNPPGMVDRTIDLEGADVWNAGKIDAKAAVAVGPTGALILDDDDPRSFPRRGRWDSAETTTEFPFTEIVPSWQLDTPADTGATIQFRVRDAETAKWSPWLYLGQWGRTIHWPDRDLWFEHGVVNTDYLLLDRAADAFQTRLDFYDYRAKPLVKAGPEPAIRRVSVAYAGLIVDEAERARLDPPVELDPRWARTLDVPYRAQRFNGWATSGMTCSPTSVSMVMSYWGVKCTSYDTAMGIWDPEYAIFGNWGRAVAYAGTQGLDARLQRFRDWDDVKREIARGVPVVASIRFDAGTFPSNVLSETDGHLIVIRGFTVEGDPVINDPASYARGNAIVYRAPELAQAWFDHGGVGYVIEGPETPEAKRE